MRFNRKDIISLAKYIEQSKTISIITHFNPDGDAIGSSSALYHYLKDLNKDILVIIPNSVPEGLMFLLEGTQYVIAEKKFKVAKERLLTSDLLFTLDMNDNSRGGEALELVLNTMQCKRVLIDHHLNPSQYDVSFSYPKASSSCEVLWNVLKRLTNKDIFSKAISTCIYSGIMTDTGSLSYSCNEPNLYVTISKLVQGGVEPNKLNKQIFDSYSLARLRLLGYLISQKMKVFYEHKAAFIYVSKKELDSYSYTAGDLEGVVNYCLKLKGINFCALLSERDNKIRMSFRSKTDDIDVNKFANKYWNGGGHKAAAGGKSTQSLQWVIKQLTKQIENEEFY